MDNVNHSVTHYDFVIANEMFPLKYNYVKTCLEEEMTKTVSFYRIYVFNRIYISY